MYWIWWGYSCFMIVGGFTLQMCVGGDSCLISMAMQGRDIVCSHQNPLLSGYSFCLSMLLSDPNPARPSRFYKKRRGGHGPAVATAGATASAPKPPGMEAWDPAALQPAVGFDRDVHAFGAAEVSSCVTVIMESAPEAGAGITPPPPPPPQQQQQLTQPAVVAVPGLPQVPRPQPSLVAELLLPPTASMDSSRLSAAASAAASSTAFAAPPSPSLAAANGIKGLPVFQETVQGSQDEMERFLLATYGRCEQVW